MKIRFLDYENLAKAKHLLVYANKNSKPIKLDGMIIEGDESIVELLYDSGIEFEFVD